MTEAQKIVAAYRTLGAFDNTHKFCKRVTANLRRISRFQGIAHFACADGSRFAYRFSNGGREVWAMPADERTAKCWNF